MSYSCLCKHRSARGRSTRPQRSSYGTDHRSDQQDSQRCGVSGCGHLHHRSEPHPHRVRGTAHGRVQGTWRVQPVRGHTPARRGPGRFDGVRLDRGRQRGHPRREPGQPPPDQRLLRRTQPSDLDLREHGRSPGRRDPLEGGRRPDHPRDDQAGDPGCRARGGREGPLRQPSGGLRARRRPSTARSSVWRSERSWRPAGSSSARRSTSRSRPRRCSSSKKPPRQPVPTVATPRGGDGRGRGAPGPAGRMER